MRRRHASETPPPDIPDEEPPPPMDEPPPDEAWGAATPGPHTAVVPTHTAVAPTEVPVTVETPAPLRGPPYIETAAQGALRGGGIAADQNPTPALPLSTPNTSECGPHPPNPDPPGASAGVGGAPASTWPGL